VIIVKAGDKFAKKVIRNSDVFTEDDKALQMVVRNKAVPWLSARHFDFVYDSKPLPFALRVYVKNKGVYYVTLVSNMLEELGVL